MIDLHHLVVTKSSSSSSSSEVADLRNVRALAVSATQDLVAGLFGLPVERSNDGPIAALPPPTTALPRAKPCPAPKAETKWEAFAKSKGIVKRKKSRMAWDDDNQQFAPTWGYMRRGDDDPPIIEVDENDLDADPRAERAQAKKARVEKNERQRVANERRLGDKKKKKFNCSSSPLASDDLIPVDVENPKRKKRGRDAVDAALATASKSTASLGNFDAKRDGEKPLKPPRGKKRAFEPLVGAKGADLERSLAVVHDIAQPRAKPPKKGQQERMDTHDFEPPNAGDARRKKGRAAVGKLKKITKKRST
ncbi:hypothetical protein CTAYLR_002673 [Chrysophaeum taylorii]|uniref:Ribosome biogenesis regulatory protein n=1 Tax=Chrysophaeum taylorii TaxID=2483200 RepID=A0AAD7UDS9_9STRA|nr:hypothetical protein CTAYLR_002673 [Chrysophaeum taylorii]